MGLIAVVWGEFVIDDGDYWSCYWCIYFYIYLDVCDDDDPDSDVVICCCRLLSFILRTFFVHRLGVLMNLKV